MTLAKRRQEDERSAGVRWKAYRGILKPLFGYFENDPHGAKAQDLARTLRTGSCWKVVFSAPSPTFTTQRSILRTLAFDFRVRLESRHSRQVLPTNDSDSRGAPAELHQKSHPPPVCHLFFTSDMGAGYVLICLYFRIEANPIFSFIVWMICMIFDHY